MRDATFELHKWHSNEPQLEDDPPHSSDEEHSYAKRQLQVQPNESKLLRVKWNKDEDTIAVQFPTTDSDTSHTATKREVLATLAKVYDPLGLASPTTLQGKQIYRDVCDVKASWDAPIPDSVKSRWEKWKESLPAEVNTQRPLAPYHEQVDSFELHAFGDASTIGVGAAVYSVVRQKSGVTQSLVTAKARLAKKDLTVPRSELVSAHMATNLVMNVKNALTELPEPAVYGWLDSTVALHWILGNGQYHQFVANRIQKIKEHPEVKWRYVPTLDNPGDIASRGGLVTNTELWWSGPAWLRDPESWPENPVTEKSKASEKEAKVTKEVLSMAKSCLEEEEQNEFDRLFNSHDLRRALRIQAWIQRFTTHRDRKGPLTSEDLREVRDWWIRRVQNLDSKKPQFTQTKNALNLIPNSEGILECRGRIQGMYSIPSSRLHVYQEAGSENPCKDPSRGSIAYNGHHSRELLDSKTQKAG